MKRGLLLKTLVVVAIAIGLSLVSAGAEDNHKFLMATGQMCHAAYLDPGTIKCIGGSFDPTTGWCTPGTRKTLTRNTVSLWSSSGVAGSAASMFQGPQTSVTNCNLDENLQGECWGTFERNIEAGGKWEGTWSGKFDFINNIFAESAVGHGQGGDVDGLNMKTEGMSPGGSSTCFTFFAQVINH